MPHLDLSAEEGKLLAEYLESAIAALRSEIVHTSDHDYKEGLKAKRESLSRILGALQEQS